METKHNPITQGNAIKQAARNPAVPMADNPLAQLRHFAGVEPSPRRPSN